MLPQPQTHHTDLPLGGYVDHNGKKVKIFGRERDEIGRVVEYSVVDESTKPFRRYKVNAAALKLLKDGQQTQQSDRLPGQ